MSTATLDLAGRLNALTTGAELGVERVRAATDLILARGVTAESIELYTDKFFDAAQEGRLPGATRQAYVAGLLRLVDALPAEGMSMVAVRTERVLVQELRGLERAISGYELEIRELDRQIQETHARVTAKLQHASELENRRRQLLRQIESANQQKQAVFVFAAVLGIATIGIGAPIAGVVGGTTMVATGIADSQRQIDRVRSELTQVDRESAALRSLSSAFEKQRTAFEANVAALRSEESALREASAKTGEGGSREVELAVELIIARTLADNLQQQIRLLRAHLQGTKELEGQLDRMIGRLESEVKSLETRAEQAQRELLQVILGTVIAMAGLHPKMRGAAMTLSKARLLTRGVDFLRMSLQAQVTKLLENAVVQGLVRATGSQLAARAIFSALDVFRGTEMRLSPEEAARLSGPQSYLLDLIARSHEGVDRTAEAEAVLARPGLSDDEARREAKRLIKSMRPAAAMMPLGSELAGWREAQAIALQVEQMLGRLGPGDHEEALAAMRELAAEAQAKLRPETPPHRALGLFLSACERDSLDLARAGLHAALAMLSLVNATAPGDGPDRK
jgi:hypothetical protein